VRNLAAAVVMAMVGLLAGPSASLIPFVGPATALATACPGVHFYASAYHTTSQSRDGGRAKWIYRPLDAPDWPDGYGGFASEVIWVATDDDPDPGNTWVEVGITNGWQHQDITTFYTAHGLNGGATYDEARWTSMSPVLAHQYRMSAAAFGADHYQAVVEDLTSSLNTTKSWPNHHPETVAMAAGSETTCSTSRVDRTYVTSPQFRTLGAFTWNIVTNGTLDWDPNVTFIAWCTQPTSYRYYQNPQNDPNTCA